MITIEHSVVISRPVQEVFAFLTEHEHDTEWRSGLVEWKGTSEGPTQVGSTSSEVLQFLGRRMETSYEITEYEENKLIGFKTTSGPIPMEGSYSVESIEAGTKLSFKISGEPGGLFKLAEPLVARTAKRQIETDFNNLKDLLESRG